MYFLWILIENFWNFLKLDVVFDGNVVVVGENKVGKSNLMYVFWLLFDFFLFDSVCEFGFVDFWDGFGGLEEDDKIVIGVEIEEFDIDFDILVLFMDFCFDDDFDMVCLIYECCV